MTDAVPLPSDGLLNRLSSVGLWFVGVLWMFPVMVSMMLLSLVVPPWRTNWLNRLYCRGQLLLTGSSWRADAGRRASRGIHDPSEARGSTMRWIPDHPGTG